jgi:fatty-acid peroxygenase
MRDESVAFLRDGYRFAAERRPSGCPTAPTRLGGRPALVVGGEEGARLFYDAGRMRRAGAIPAPTRAVIFGRGAVQGLDGAEHAHRKALFVNLLDDGAVRAITGAAGRRWSAQIKGWAPGRPVVVQDVAATVLGGAVLEWVGIGSTPAEEEARSHQLLEVVDGFGSHGPRYLRSTLARRRSEAWLRDAVLGARRSPAAAAPALLQVAHQRSLDGRLLDPAVAAVELHNLVRPTVAVSWLVAYAVLAMAADPTLRLRLARGDEESLEAFAHELRRAYPFVPVLAAEATRDFTWRGQPVREGERVLLDVYGSQHDPMVWDDPDRFDIERFAGREPGPFELLAQGGGDARTGHRCPGERLTVELVKDAARRLAAVPWSLAAAVTVGLRRMPPYVRHIRLRPEAGTLPVPEVRRPATEQLQLLIDRLAERSEGRPIADVRVEVRRLVEQSGQPVPSESWIDAVTREAVHGRAYVVTLEASGGAPVGNSATAHLESAPARLTVLPPQPPAPPAPPAGRSGRDRRELVSTGDLVVVGATVLAAGLAVLKGWRARRRGRPVGR